MHCYKHLTSPAMKPRALITVVLLLSVALVCHAQETTNWDTALDRYELICERCRELQRQQAEGKDIPQESMSSLLVQLSMLKQSLGEAGSSMTKAQKTRFEMIRQRMAAGAGTASAPASSKVASGNAQAKRKTVISGTGSEPCPMPVRPDPIPAVSFMMPGRILSYAEPCAILPPVMERPEEQSPAPRETRPSILLAMQLGMPSTRSYGLFCGIGGERWGGYIKARYDFQSRLMAPPFKCDSQGTIEGGGTIWGNGESAAGRYTVSAGAIYIFHPHWNLYCGAGYGAFSTTAYDIDGNPYLVTDLTCKGISFNLGCLFHFYRHCFAGLGTDWCQFRKADVEITLGVEF